MHPTPFQLPVAFVCIALLGAPHAAAQLNPTPPAPLNANATGDSGADQSVRVASLGTSLWIAVWSSSDDFLDAGEDADIFVARSTNNGATWTPPAPLNSNAETDAGADAQPDLATNRSGAWVVVWSSKDDFMGAGTDDDIFVCHSTNNGASWSATTVLNGNAGSDSGEDSTPFIQTDGKGNWVVVWASNEDLSGAEDDYDIFVARSANNGTTWTAPAVLNTNAGSDDGDDYEQRIATDGNGNWVVVWESNEDLSGSDEDSDIFIARSTDNGATWTPPGLLNTNATTDSGNDQRPKIATDGSGTWVAIWESKENLSGAGTDKDIFVAQSTNNGLTWTPPLPLNTNAAADSGDDLYASLAADSKGNWVAAWTSYDSFGGSGDDADVFAAHSTNSGATWTAPVVVNTHGTSDARPDLEPCVALNGPSSCIVAWHSNNDVRDTGDDYDILLSRPTLGSSGAGCAGSKSTPQSNSVVYMAALMSLWITGKKPRNR